MPFEEKEPEKEATFEKETPKDEKGRDFTILSRVNTFFGWLGELVKEQAQTEAKTDDATPPTHLLHEIKLRQQKTSEVITTAQMICEHLDDLKQKLVAEFGPNLALFISKCIDPMTEHARRLIAALEAPEKENASLQSLLEQAIESVELYSQFNDESKLRQRIVQIAQGLLKQAIEKDLEVLANYKQQAIAENPMDEGSDSELDRYLYPIVSELIGLSNSHLETDDIHAFLVWKTNVDTRRNSLVELGLLTIDTMTGHKEKAESLLQIEDDSGTEQEKPLAELAKHTLEDSALTLSFLSLLEERRDYLQQLIAENSQIEQDQYEQAKELIEHLKLDSERLEKLAAHTKQVIDSFHKLKSDLLKAEQLLEQKHNHLP